MKREKLILNLSYGFVFLLLLAATVCHEMPDDSKWGLFVLWFDLIYLFPFCVSFFASYCFARWLLFCSAGKKRTKKVFCVLLYELSVVPVLWWLLDLVSGIKYLFPVWPPVAVVLWLVFYRRRGCTAGEKRMLSGGESIEKKKLIFNLSYGFVFLLLLAAAVCCKTQTFTSGNLWAWSRVSLAPRLLSFVVSYFFARWLLFYRAGEKRTKKIFCACLYQLSVIPVLCWLLIAVNNSLHFIFTCVWALIAVVLWLIFYRH